MDIGVGKDLSVILEQIRLLQNSTMSALHHINQMQPEAAELYFYTAKKAAKDVKDMFDDLGRQVDESKSNRS